jgi:hypothetical protein
MNTVQRAVLFHWVFLFVATATPSPSRDIIDGTSAGSRPSIAAEFEIAQAARDRDIDARRHINCDQCAG